jgi:glucose-6-phosphate isomerase
MSEFVFTPGPIEHAFRSRLSALQKEGFVHRLRDGDPSLWSSDRAQREAIRNRLGWLDPFDKMEAELGEVLRFASEARGRFRDVLLLGMGGSSLAPDVLGRTFGARSRLRLRVLDSTDPEAVRDAEADVDLDSILVLVASKSGTTAEIEAFRRYFASRIPDPARFAAITDPDSPLDRLASEEGYLRVFRNPADIGGRYSVFSLFGLVPAALLGMDVRRWLLEGRLMFSGCHLDSPLSESQGVPLGVFLAEAALAGRDKLTLLVSSRFPGFGAWVEQLVAESTGKDGKGILPIDGEPPSPVEAYGDDRVFVVIESPDPMEDLGSRAEALARAGHPVARVRVPDRMELGPEFYRWEFATATAAAILGVNAFDEPNVKESKDLTGELLARFAETGRLEEGIPRRDDGEFTIHSDGALSLSGPTSHDDWIRAHLARARRGEYVALLAFLPPTGEVSDRLGALRAAIRARTGLAVPAGFGPRFLHSTGQYFKGGPDRGVFLQLESNDWNDLPIPGLPHTFGVLKRAQAVGDFQALARRGRRVLRVRFKGEAEPGIERIRRVVESWPG